MKQDYAKEDKELKPMATIVNKEHDQAVYRRVAGKLIEQDKQEYLAVRQPIMDRFEIGEDNERICKC